jgi:NADH:ubiquinone reductase (H+-translocating)
MNLQDGARARANLGACAENPEGPQVVIVGAGFGGLAAARSLRRAPVRVLVADRENHHLFQPLVYQVAMAALSATDIAAPVRSILARQANTRVALAEVTSIDLDAKLVHARLYTQEPLVVAYDYLVLATGAEPNYFGHETWAPFAPSPKSLDAALEIRKRVLLAFEDAECEADPRRLRQLLEFVVVGGGATGVEFAGALAELSRSTLARDFRRIDPRQTRVHLVESGSRVLAQFPERLSLAAARQLEELGVVLHVGSTVVDVDASGVTLANGTKIESATVIWGAGIRPTSLARTLRAPHDRAGRIVVEQDLSIPGHPDAFVVGDVAHFEPAGQSTPLPGLAPVATQQGRAVARTIARSVRGQGRVPFRYRDKGSLATIGRSRGIGVIGRAQLSGFLAWAAWALVHVFYLVGFRNRLVVLLEWMWNYVTYKRGARVIEGLHEVPPAPSPTPTRAEHADGLADGLVHGTKDGHARREQAVSGSSGR